MPINGANWGSRGKKVHGLSSAYREWEKERAEKNTNKRNVGEKVSFKWEYLNLKEIFMG